MLLLTRKDGESIFIDKGTIRIKVIRRKRGSMTLGIEAPPNMDVDREEIFLRKQAELAQQGNLDENTR